MNRFYARLVLPFIPFLWDEGALRRTSPAYDIIQYSIILLNLYNCNIEKKLDLLRFIEKLSNVLVLILIVSIRVNSRFVVYTITQGGGERTERNCYKCAWRAEWSAELGRELYGGSALTDPLFGHPASTLRGRLGHVTSWHTAPYSAQPFALLQELYIVSYCCTQKSFCAERCRRRRRV